ncbi:hypothetical protein LTR37_002931 [Vermiconidia calcicola]|uniref:Uncharacterized protein n=1 Tax=Vermiconidia calcicola TaxID=1690605 RepID=A0ACC3NT13_9PEZI|nr:hypothetical protein LTR37_002931 [Vermiconidia calcicola]
MSVIDLLLLIFSVHSFASPILRRGPQSGDAPYSVDAATLAAALTCPNGSPTSTAPPVLLVHGTISTGEESWGEGYVPALLANGYTPCYVTLPSRALGDMQVSAEYVAHSLHQISDLAGGAKTAVITHSQGGPVTQWALRFWPSTQSVVGAFIALSPDFAGIELGNSQLSDICIGDLCQSSIWQQSSGSNYYEALHANDFGVKVPTTSIWTKFDGVVEPAKENAQLPGAAVMSVQDLCPGRLTHHVFMTVDAAAFALALDALKHGGTASVSRVRANGLSAIGTCLRIVAPKMRSTVAESLGELIKELAAGFL